MEKIKLYVHIGNGKTGSTSIQKSLQERRDELLKRGVLYLGRFMELAPVKIYEWQDFRKKELFWQLSDQQRLEQVAAVLRASLEKVGHVSSIVWSHESFINRHMAMAPLLQGLPEMLSLDVYPVAYIRRHEDWSVSAYFQWGLKHKSVKGFAVPSFKDWMQAKPARLFSVVLNKWQRDFEDRFVLRNFDAVKSPVDDFYAILGVTFPSNASVHSYKTPDAEELYFRTVFNFSHKDEVLPGRFDKEVSSFPFRRHVLKPSEFNEKVLPRGSVVEAEKERLEEDKKIVNKLLFEKGQPELTDSDSSFDYSVDQEKLLSMAIHMIVSQEKKIFSLERRLAELETKN
ncbi:hypothetical protein ACGTN6_18055 [Halomonas sp. THAF12]|uniref:hypothetical protein n=1 Tax=Halomonas sp. B23F22_10 TaxID=3459515 RepID=UPI00373E6993